MKHTLAWFAALALAGAAHAASGAPAASPDNNKNVFSFLPKSFQSNPQVDFNVITEMTNEGRAAPKPASGTPIYYVMIPGAFAQRGHGTAANEKPPAVDRMAKLLEQGLRENGYLPADQNNPEHQPGLLIVLSWGSHSSPGLAGTDDDTSTIANETLIQDLVERARLVGGEKYASELVKAMAEDGKAKSGMYKPHQDTSGTGFGDSSPVAALPDTQGDGKTNFFSAVRRFQEKSNKNTALFFDSASSIYFVVASAFDYKSAATPSKILLWRTKMSVASQGVSMGESLPALIVAASPFLGKDMSETEIVPTRIHREGKVEIGETKVVGYEKTLPPENSTQTPSAPAASTGEAKKP